ncbi:MAG: class I SAM-dependent methyltransferase [Silvanigrellaceae bacterium]
MQSKRPHPALSFAGAQKRMVKLAGLNVPVWMAPDIDKLLESFIEANDADTELNQERRCPFGAVLWPSARALWEWLMAAEDRWQSVAKDKSDATVTALELGSGVGFFSALLASQTQWNLTASDYEPAYEDYLHANCELQGVGKVPFRTLDWCEPTPADLRHKFDLIIACDVFYDDSHLDSVPRIARELLKPEGILLIADPERFRYTTALEKLKGTFDNLQIHTTTIENSPEEASQSGVVNPNIRKTTIQIVRCQNTLTQTRQ